MATNVNVGQSTGGIGSAVATLKLTYTYASGGSAEVVNHTLTASNSNLQPESITISVTPTQKVLTVPTGAGGLIIIPEVGNDKEYRVHTTITAAGFAPDPAGPVLLSLKDGAYASIYLEALLTAFDATVFWF